MRSSVFGLLLLCGSLSALADIITIRADEWLPYNGPASGKPPGYMIEMAQEIAAANGHKVEYLTLPWESAVAETRKGEFDCVVGALKSDAEGFAFPSTPWGSNVNGFFALQEGKWTYTGIESLSAIRLAVVAGYSYSEEIDAYIAANKNDPSKVVVVQDSGRALINAVFRLTGGKADVVLEDTNVAANTFKRINMTSRMKQVGQLGKPEPLYIACTPANQKGKLYADMFSRGTATLRSSGRLAEILEKYGVSDWQP